MRLLLIPVILISISCTNNKKEQNEKIKPKIESVIINTDTLGIPSYPVFSHYLKYTDLHFIGYNDLLHSLDIYNLTEEKFIDRIILDSDGPKSVGPINGLYYHNKDSIFTFSRGKISLFDEGYTSFHYFDLFQIIQEQNLDFEPIINQHFRLIYDPISKTIPLQNIFYGNKKSYAPNKNLISKLNIKENRIEEIPFTHTEQYEYV
ncbi:DUF4221 family protein, partial [Marivirga sp.]|uniref:DUF4221 family protein n=1 Tax=Marivirga sp. TaxID=2018662 RepID=UPI0025D9F711